MYFDLQKIVASYLCTCIKCPYIMMNTVCMWHKEIHKTYGLSVISTNFIHFVKQYVKHLLARLFQCMNIYEYEILNPDVRDANITSLRCQNRTLQHLLKMTPLRHEGDFWRTLAKISSVRWGKGGGQGLLDRVYGHSNDVTP